jgi:dTDP-glucose pyrophosphorylase
VSERWKRALVPPEASLRQAIEAIDKSGVQIALVVDESQRLLGTVTDGDVRRALLRGIGVDAAVRGVMNATPTVVSADESPQRILELMRRTTLRCIPGVDARGRVVRVFHMNDFLQPERRRNTVVVMAGGLGTRLDPLTKDLPKPLLKVGSKPILETILSNFRGYGFAEFFLSVNYKAEMVKSYFGDGTRWGIRIRYLEESVPLGTAGSLSLLPERPTLPLVVMNGDLVTQVNFQHMLDFHREHAAVATMGVREYDMQVPFGVVRLEESRIVAIEEKPVHRFFVNAGIYVLEPDALDYVPRGEYFDMTTLFERLAKEGMPTSAFPIREYWLDVGRPDDLERAQIEYGDIGP